MKKIIISASIILAASAIIAGGTYAYFSDTETSTGNTFTSGTLDLKADGQDGQAVVHITRSGLKPYPHWSHSFGGQWVLKNDGSIPGKFSMKIVNIKNYENNCNDPENKAGDTTCGTETNAGELGSLMYGRWSRNQAPWGGWGPVFDSFNTAEGIVVQGDTLNPGETVNAYLDLEWDTHSGLTDNLGQGDSLEFDIVFTLEQITP